MFLYISSHLSCYYPAYVYLCFVSDPSPQHICCIACTHKHVCLCSVRTTFDGNTAALLLVAVHLHFLSYENLQEVLPIDKHRKMTFSSDTTDCMLDAMSNPSLLIGLNRKPLVSQFIGGSYLGSYSNGEPRQQKMPGHRTYFDPLTDGIFSTTVP